MDAEYLKQFREQFLNKVSTVESLENPYDFSTKKDGSENGKRTKSTDKSKQCCGCTEDSHVEKLQDPATKKTKQTSVMESPRSRCSTNKFIYVQPDSQRSLSENQVILADASDQMSAASSLPRTLKSGKGRELLDIVKRSCKEQKEYKAQAYELALSAAATYSERSIGTSTSEELKRQVRLQNKQLGRLMKNYPALADIREEKESKYSLKSSGQCHATQSPIRLKTASGRSYEVRVDEIINGQTQQVLGKIQEICIDNVQQTVNVLKSLSQLPKDITHALKTLE